jgi:hypothetical protein
MGAEEPETQAAETRAAAAEDPTEVVDDHFTRLRKAAGTHAEAEFGEAWSDEDGVDEAESDYQPWSAVTGHAAALLSVGAAVAVITVGWMMLHQNRPPNPPTPRNITPPRAAAPITPPPSTVTIQAAQPQAFSGRYNVTETWSNGHVETDTWDVIACGPKCVNITPETGGSTVQALLHSGSEKAWAGATDGHLIWTFSHGVADTGCPGSHGGAAFIIDAYTLSGTVTKVFDAACGQQAETDVDKIVLTSADWAK